MRTIITIAMLLLANTALAQIKQITTYYGLSNRAYEVYAMDMATGQKHGKYVRYKERNDGLAITGTYNQGNKVGTWVYYIPTINQNVPYLTSHYNSKGELHGLWDGKECMLGCQYEKGMYVNGKREGIWTFQYIDDANQLQEKTNYKNDYPDGPSVFYYKGGLIETKQTYKMGVVVDTVFVYKNSNAEPRLKRIKVYDKDGKLVSEEDF